MDTAAVSTQRLILAKKAALAEAVEKPLATVADVLTAAGFCEILCYRDLAGHDRVTVCRAAPTGC